MKTIARFAGLLVLLLLAACEMPLTAEPTATRLPTLTLPAPAEDTPVIISPSPQPDASETPLPPITAEPTQTLEPTITATPSPTPVVFTPFKARVWANNVNLRSNPGYLFSTLRQLQQGDEFTVLGQAPGMEWLYVQVGENLYGWVFTLLVESEYDLQTVPAIQPTGVQVVHGRVLTPGGEPINGLQFAIQQGPDPGGLRTDAMTTDMGSFIAYLPLDAGGEWRVVYVAISCKSVVHDENCNTRPEYAGSVHPESQTITLPYNAVLEFEWK